ncbi:MAG: HAMP domain-containing protein [Anaerolineales bacterium]|nr:HAMP domain-containing protein [Anaerolineales bacterium]
MNRLWVRISLSFVGIVIFLIMIPLMITISMRNFDVAGSPEGVQAIEEGATNDRPGGPPERFAEISGKELVTELLKFVAVITAIGTTVGILSTRGLTAPLNKLADAAKAIGEKDLSQRVEVRGSDEIKTVALAFNEMASQLGQAETLRGNLLNDVAHELRTPISVIQGNLRAILDDVYELDKAEIARLYDQTRHLSRLVDDLSELAQAEARQLSLNISEVEIVPWVQDIAAVFQPIIDQKGVNLRVEILGQHPLIRADRERLTQVLHNLLSNAIQHTLKGGRITIQVEQHPGRFYLRVSDTGEGIQLEHLSHVFDRFYRADPARSRETGGTGLGLAISRAIVEAHGGEISVISAGVGKGSEFAIQLPQKHAQ